MSPIRSPLPALAIALARQGHPREAWTRWETGLARGLLDDLAARSLRPLTAEERRREASLAGQLQQFDEVITLLTAQARRNQDDDALLDRRRRERGALRSQWVEFQNALDHRYGAYVGRPLTLEDVQKTLPADTALVGWLDESSRHWACVVRRSVDPTWVPIAGSGPEGAWTREDDERPRKLRAALAGHQPTWTPLVEALARQRIGPLQPHLKGVKHLIVLPSPALPGLPIETLVASKRPGDPAALVVSYAPSGSIFARLAAQRIPAPGPNRILALGDPDFPRPVQRAAAPKPPDHGLAIKTVEPNGTADLFGIKPGDVLLEYNNRPLKSFGDLASFVSAAGKTAGACRSSSGATGSSVRWRSPLASSASSPTPTAPSPRSSWLSGRRPRSSGRAPVVRA